MGQNADFTDPRYTINDVRHSFETIFGETIDCVEFPGKPKTAAAQPNAEQSLASQVASLVDLPDHLFNGKPDKFGRPRTCIGRGMPILRQTPERIRAARSPKPFEAQSGLGSMFPRTSRPPLSGSDAETDGFAHLQWIFNGAQSITQAATSISIFTPKIGCSNGAGDDHSVQQIWLVSGSADTWHNCTNNCYQTMEAGWTVDIRLNGDRNPHFMTFATNDGYRTYCYNHVGPSESSGCLEFDVPPNAPLTPGATLPTSIIGGVQNYIWLQIANTGSAWGLSAQPAGGTVGSWPSSQFSMMHTTAENFAVGGETHISCSKQWASVDMGSGAPATAGYGQAAYFSNFYACTSQDGCSYTNFNPVRWTSRLMYGQSTTPPPPAGTNWTNYFYIGNEPILGWFVGGAL